MRIWPWSELHRLRSQLAELANSYESCLRGNEHFQRVLESIPPEVAEEAQRNVSDWYLAQARAQSNSVWKS